MNHDSSYTRFQFLETMLCSSSSTGKHMLVPDSIGGQKCSACRDGAFTLTNRHAEQRGLQDADEYGLAFVPQQEIERFLRTGQLPDAPGQGFAREVALGFAIMIGVIGLVGWGVLRWTGSWWSIPLLFALIVFVVLAVGKSKAQHRGRTTLAATAIAILIMTTAFPNMLEGAPGDSQTDICQRLADGSTTRAELADAYQRETGVSLGEALASTIAYVGQNCPQNQNR